MKKCLHTKYTHVGLCKELPNDGVGVARGTVFQEIQPRAGFETSGFVKV